MRADWGKRRPRIVRRLAESQGMVRPRKKGMGHCSAAQVVGEGKKRGIPLRGSPNPAQEKILRLTTE